MAAQEGKGANTRKVELISSLLLFAWVFLMNYIRQAPTLASALTNPPPPPNPNPVYTVLQNPAYAYVGIVAAFTAGVLILGYDGSLSVAEYAMARIEMTCYGVAIWLFISTNVFSPNEVP